MEPEKYELRVNVRDLSQEDADKLFSLILDFANEHAANMGGGVAPQPESDNDETDNNQDMQDA